MTSINVCLNSIEKVKQFVGLITQYDSDFDLTCSRYVVDAKSIMGIFSLDLSKPLKLDIHDDACAEEILALISDFIVDK